MTAVSEPRRLAVWQTEPCPDWCVWHHNDSDRGEDRMHLSEEARVALWLYPATDSNRDPVDGSRLADHEDWHMPWVTAYVTQRVGEASRRVVIETEDLETQTRLTLTLAEAEALSEMLRRLVADTDNCPPAGGGQ